MSDYLAKAVERLEVASTIIGADQVAIAHAYIDLHWASKNDEVVSGAMYAAVTTLPAEDPAVVGPAEIVDAPVDAAPDAATPDVIAPPVVNIPSPEIPA